MGQRKIRLDFTYAKNDLQVRSVVATALGVAWRHDLTWNDLSEAISRLSPDLAPSQIRVAGTSNLGQANPMESRSFDRFLDEFKRVFPSVCIEIVICD